MYIGIGNLIYFLEWKANLLPQGKHGSESGVHENVFSPSLWD
jgi:hypothetical protein